MSHASQPGMKRYVPAVGPRLRKLLAVVLGLFSLLAVNSTYMVGVTVLEALSGRTYQNWFYLLMFLMHLALGLLITVPVVVFGGLHIRNAHDRPNRRAVWVGYGLFATALVLIASGVVLTRLEGVIVVKDPTVRSISYWAHVLSPLIAAWLFVLHRLAGRRIRWRVGARWAAVAAVFAGVLLILQAQDPRRWNVAGPESGEQYFFPSLARTATGDFIPARVLQNSEYCKECHADIYEGWHDSVHHFSSFNNPPYEFSVSETRRVGLEIDGSVQGSRFCAGCHDPVPFFSGSFDDPEFDFENDPTGQAGVTCTVCHAISNINSVRGNSDYTIEEPIHYPFAFSDNRFLGFLNRQLIKAKPEFHRRTFLKPHHKTAEFCGTCHKVHLPEELNHYKFLRGQNHYDSFLLSGVSGHGAQSFYYPEKAQTNCNGCHMGLFESDDFGARDFDGSGALKVHDHMFPSANTAIPKLVGLPDADSVIAAHQKFLEGIVRIDLFGLRRGGTIDGELVAPLRPEQPGLQRGERVLLETVVRTVKLGHHFTQGTADSNQIWVEVEARAGDRLIGRSGGMNGEGRVDPWSHFVNVYMLDRDGNRVDRRNAQDIFVPLYNHQIPPGAADVVHFALEVPPDVGGPVEVTARLKYRKFDTTYMQYVYGPDYSNDLPVTVLAEDRIVLPLDAERAEPNGESPIIEWQRWNDYGIALLRKGGKSKGELRQAADAFARVEELGRPDGPLNLARVYLAQGTVEQEAVDALERAASFDPPAPAWVVTWLTGLVNMQNGYFDEAITNFRTLAQSRSSEQVERGFDFSRDYRVWNMLGQALFERAKSERGSEGQARRAELLEESRDAFQAALLGDPENVTAHYNLNLVLRQLGEEETAKQHLDAYLKYKEDDNARDSAIAKARAADPAANHAAEAIVIYDLTRPQSLEWDEGPRARPASES